MPSARLITVVPVAVVPQSVLLPFSRWAYARASASEQAPSPAVVSAVVVVTVTSERPAPARPPAHRRPVLLSLELTVAGKADLAGLTLGAAVSIACVVGSSE